MQINPKEVIERGIIKNISNVNEQLQQVGIDLTLKHALKLEQGQFANVEVNEEFNMQDTFGLIIVRSSLSRKGIFMSSGCFDPGFAGVGGISLYAFGTAIELPAGFRVGQMIVFKGDPAKMYEGHYNKNQTITSQYSFEGVKLN